MIDVSGNSLESHSGRPRRLCHVLVFRLRADHLSAQPLALHPHRAVLRFHRHDVPIHLSRAGWNFADNENTFFASWGQKMIYWGPLKPLENALLRSPLAGWAYAAGILYHNGYWLNTIGKGRVRKALKTEWGRLWENY